jgi:hypothetical protein
VHGRNGRSKYTTTRVAPLIDIIVALKRAVLVLCYVRGVLVTRTIFGKVQVKVGVTKNFKGNTTLYSEVRLTFHSIIIIWGLENSV